MTRTQDKKIRDAYVKVLLRIEEEKGEKIIHFSRIALSLLYLAIALLVRPQVEPVSFMAILSAGIVSLLFSAWTHYRIFRSTLSARMKLFSSIFDVALVSVIMPQFGGHIVFKSEAIFLYYVWVALVNLRFSARLTIATGAAATLFYAAIFCYFAAAGKITFAPMGEAYAGAFVSLASIALQLVFFGAFVAAAAAMARANRRLLDKSVQTELEASKQYEDRIRGQMESLQKTQQMLEAFSRFVPQQFVHYLQVDDILQLKLGHAVQKDMTLLFVDIRNFTGLSEKMSVQENFRFLNAYLKRMNPIIESHGGIVDKFIGDEIMALFLESAENALKAAVAMRKELYVYNTDRRRMDYPPIEIGAGLHCGNVMLGTVGSENRISTTVIGDNVNLASRLQGLTRVFHTGIILSDFVYRSLPDPAVFHLREIDSVLVKGKEKPVVLYECFDADTDQVRDEKERSAGEMQLALSLYKAGNFDEAETLLVQIGRDSPADPLPEIYLKRLDKLKKRPAGAPWTGVSRMK
jgi:class 3 adenylate cyclase